MHQYKAKDSEIKRCCLCWKRCWNISKDLPIDHMKNTGLDGYVYHFSVDYDAIAV